MGWVMNCVRTLRQHQFGNVVLSRYPIVHHSQYRPVVADVRAAQLPARGPRTSTARSCTSTTSTSAPPCSSGATRPSRLASFVHDRRVTGPKVILGDFNEWMKGLATKTLSSLFESVDISQHLKRRRTYPGLFPVVHLDHIYYEGHVDVRSVEMPRTRKALMASDHLPLVATTSGSGLTRIC